MKKIFIQGVNYEMSYMNPNTDPFGIPYSTTCVENKTKETKKYSFENLKKLHKEQRKIQDELFDIKTEKKKAIEYLTEKLQKYVYVYAEIEIDDKPQFLTCKIITERFELSQLERIKKDFNLKDIKVEMGSHKIGDEYRKRIIISLEW